MNLHPELMLSYFHARERELIAEADRTRLLAAARQRIRAGTARSRPAARGWPAGTLITCEPHEAAPAR